MPPGAYNRLADNWRPLFAIAQAAGGDWPRRALEAFNHLTNPRFNASTVQRFNDSTIDSQLLLADIRQIFNQSGRTRFSSKELVDSLCALRDRPWRSLAGTSLVGAPAPSTRD